MEVVSVGRDAQLRGRRGHGRRDGGPGRLLSADGLSLLPVPSGVQAGGQGDVHRYERSRPDNRDYRLGPEAIGVDLGLPVVEDVPGVKLAPHERGARDLDLTDEGQKSVDLGDKVWLTPWDIANCVNVYDYIQASRNGKLEAVWNVAARGHYR